MSKSDNRQGTFLKSCKKCRTKMNGDMLDAQGVCLRCKAKAGEELQKKMKDKRGVATYNANESMDSEPAYSNFITSDRSGRRNAVHELQGDATALSLQKLVGSMEDVAIEGGENKEEVDAIEEEPAMTPKSQEDGPTL